MSVKNFKSFGIINRIYTSYLSGVLRDRDLSYSDSIFLLNIGENNGINQEQLSELLAIDKAAAARSVKHMEKRGYLYCLRSKADRRSKELYLSEKGRDLYLFLQSRNEEWLRQTLGFLPEEDARHFLKTLEQIEARAKALGRRLSL